jgi:predicted AlkP superfamily phosphohydrolase/phosphomutase
MHPRVLVIGLDGGTFSIVDPLIEAGRLPNLKRLIDSGVRAPLLSTRPPLTPVAWGAFMTGCGPGKHGTYAFVRVRPEDYGVEFLNGSHLRVPTLWEIVSRQGRRCGAHNVPWTYPPRRVNGFVLSGLDAPAFDGDIAWPPGLFERVTAATGPYFEKFVPSHAVMRDVGRLGRQVSQCGAVARWLLDAEPVDFFMTVFSTTDHVQHNFWSERRQGHRGAIIDDVIHYTYEQVDAEIGRLLDAHADGDTTVMIVSDHGAGPCRGAINLDRWFEEQGWLAFRPHRIGLLDAVRRVALGAARRLSSRRLRARLQRHAPATRERLASVRMVEGIDWSGTKAYTWSDYGNVQLNVRGRQGLGIVEPSTEYEAVCNELRAALLELRHPEDDRPVVEKVHRAGDLYVGPHVEKAPDLLVETRDYEYEIITHLTPGGPIPTEIDAEVFPPALRSGTHRAEGMLIAAGPGIRPGVRIEAASLVDMTPTILHMLDVPVPSYMDGHVVADLWESEALASRPPTYAEEELPDVAGDAPYSDEEAVEVERHLRDLGYV